MKTRESTLKDMRRSLVPGTPAFLYQYEHGGWGWASAGSPNGEVLEKAAETGLNGVFVDSRGRAVAPFHNVERVVS